MSTLKVMAIALHKQQSAESARREALTVEAESQSALNHIHDTVMRCLKLSEEEMKSATLSTVDTGERQYEYRLHIDGLTFRTGVRDYRNEIFLQLAPCPRCGHERFTHGITTLGALGAVLAQDGDDWTPHRCPDEPEYWLINRDVRETEIEAAAARRAANEAQKADRLQTVLSTLVGAGVSQDSVADMLTGFMAIATGLALRVAERGTE